MGDNGEYSISEDRQLMSAYDSINKITNYKKIGCNEMKVTKESSYYEDQIEKLDSSYNDIIANYSKQYTNYQMYLAKQDFFTNTDGTDADFDTELANKVFSKNIKPRTPPKDPPNVNTETEAQAKQDLFDRADDIYAKSENYGKDWADQNWYNGNPFSETTSLSEVNNLEIELVNIQQQLAGLKNNLENDIHSMESCIIEVNEEIDKLELGNKSLRKKISSFRTDKATGEGKLYDSQNLYNQYYLGNWIVGIIILFVVYKTVKYVMNNQRVINEGVSKVRETASTVTDTVSGHVDALKTNVYNIV